MSILEQSVLMNQVHGAEAIIHVTGTGLGLCSLQRWKTFLAEYTLPEIPYPMIAIQTAGRAKNRRISKNMRLSSDYVMPGDMTIVPRMQKLDWYVNGEVDIATITFENPETCDHLQKLYYGLRSQSADQNHVGSFNNSYIYATCNHLINILSDPDKVNQDYIDTLLRGVEMYVLNYLGKKNNGLNPAKEPHSHYVAYALKRLTIGIKTKLNVEDIARELRVSPSYLTRKFKEEVGTTPHHFLLMSRIKRARKLLAATDVDIVTIAEEAGFSDQSHLTRHFSKQVGMSPLKYRRYVKKDMMNVEL
ncbi:MAG: helix-turn-helix domain-containing protein [Porticoccaceae bacterium]